jgi:Skp family chaperone for outer membrane proteins
MSFPRLALPVLVCFTLLLAENIFAQGNAYIRRDTLLTVLPGYTLKVSSFDSLKTAFSEELKIEQQKLEQKVNALFTSYSPKSNETTDVLIARLSQADASRYALLQKESVLLEERSKSYNEILQMNYSQNVQPLLTKLNKTIEQYAVKNKLDMVFILEDIAPALAYVNKGKDITGAVILLVTK